MHSLDVDMLWCRPLPPQTTTSESARRKALCPHLSSGSWGIVEFPRIVSIESVAPLAVSPPIISKDPKSVYLVRLGKIVDDLIVDVVGVASADVVGVVMAVAGDKVVSVDIPANELVGGVGGRGMG